MLHTLATLPEHDTYFRKIKPYNDLEIGPVRHTASFSLKAQRFVRAAIRGLQAGCCICTVCESIPAGCTLHLCTSTAKPMCLLVPYHAFRPSGPLQAKLRDTSSIASPEKANGATNLADTSCYTIYHIFLDTLSPPVHQRLGNPIRKIRSLQKLSLVLHPFLSRSPEVSRAAE